jgi:hypothetical protein
MVKSIVLVVHVATTTTEWKSFLQKSLACTTSLLISATGPREPTMKVALVATYWAEASHNEPKPVLWNSDL